jgi:hypothetical protein
MRINALRFLKTIVGAGLALAIGTAAAVAQDVTVRMLHVNETGDPFWKKIAEDYNATHKGVKVIVDYMENEAYKAKLPDLAAIRRPARHHLFLGRRRDARRRSRPATSRTSAPTRPSSTR